MSLMEHHPKGIEGRVVLLRDMVAQSVRDPEISRNLALHVTRGAPWRDDRSELQAIWWFMQSNIRYTGDIAGHDTFQTARQTLRFNGGDCDDGFTLIATLCMGNGFQIKGRITANDPKGPWAHIYPMVGVPKGKPNRWFPLDWTLGAARFGAHPPQGRHLEFDGYRIVYSPQEITPAAYMGWR